MKFAWVTCRLDGSDLHCAVGPEQWDKGGHHGTWFPDGRRISMNPAITLGLPKDFLGTVSYAQPGKVLLNVERKPGGTVVFLF